jgi:glycosyltransferase involved in cell wall biosynthesis
VVVLPSYREGTPRTLLEAAAMGKPLIATDVPGCNSVVKDGYNGFLCELNNEEDLANKMMHVLSLSNEERVRIGQNSRKHVEEVFDERLVIDHYSKKIDELTKNQHSSSK